MAMPHLSLSASFLTASRFLCALEQEGMVRLDLWVSDPLEEVVAPVETFSSSAQATTIRCLICRVAALSTHSEEAMLKREALEPMAPTQSCVSPQTVW